VEPTGIAEIKFRAKDQMAFMHSADAQLQMLDAQLADVQLADIMDSDAEKELKDQIADREAVLKPVYLQAATEFCDLHDKTGRMKAVGVIRDAVEWESSREYFFKRAKRRMIEDEYIKQLTEASPISDKEAKDILRALGANDETWNNDAAMIDFYDSKKADIEAKIDQVGDDAIRAKIEELKAKL